MRLIAVKAIAGLALGTLLLATPAAAETASVAVASNFTAVAEALAVAFKTETGHGLTLSFGASGALYTQISQGAPFEVFLSADTKRPALAVTEGFGVEGSVFTYAIGKLALYSSSVDVTDGKAVLEAGAFEKLAIADPETAPYGAAAVSTLEALGLTEATTPKLVTGENISQTLQFVESGSAEVGFVALSQVQGKPASQLWLVPVDLYEPILQDAVLLKTGEANPAATAFLEFLRGETAKAIIEGAGYEVASD